MKFVISDYKFYICLSLSVLILERSFTFVGGLSTNSKSQREPSLMESINNFFSLYEEPQTKIQKITNEIDENRKYFNFKETKISNSNRFKIQNREKGLYDTEDSTPSTKIPIKNEKSPQKQNKIEVNSTNTELWLDKIHKKIRKTPKILQEGWFMISSTSFQSKIFPPIKRNNKELSKIAFDENYFRINHAYSLFSGVNKPPSDKFFWFRLSGLNFYYTVSVCDTNILGSFSVENISSPSEIEEEEIDKMKIFCFEISNNSSETWKLCSLDQIKLKIILCQLNRILRIKSDSCKKPKISLSTRKVIQPMIIIPKPSKSCNEDWNYKKGGDDWECECREGREQSPIDLPNTEKAIDSIVTPLFHFTKANSKHQVGTFDGITKENQGVKIKLLDNSLRMFSPYFGKLVTVDGAVYRAEELIIHTPSEHTIEGKRYDAELQVLYFGQTKGDIAKQVLLSFLFEGTPGEYNKFFESIDIFNLPNYQNIEKILDKDIFIPNVFYNTDEENNDILQKFSFYTYQGSLTFPPCTENTIIYVASKPIPLSTTVITLMQESIRIPDKIVDDKKIFIQDSINENARKIQNINGRPVFHFNHEKNCGLSPSKKKKKEEQGHFEKVKLIHQKIFYVTDKKPSEMPESFVIGEDEAFGKNLFK